MKACRTETPVNGMEKQKSVLFYINGLGNGGAERAICNTASYFAEHGWNTILLTSFRSQNEYSYSTKIRRMSIEDSQIIQSRIKRNVSRIKAIRRICKKERVDVMVSFMGEPNFRALLATIGLKTKNVISVRSDPNVEYRGLIGKIVASCLLPRSEGAVFQTKDAKDWFNKSLQKRAAVIYNIVDAGFYSEEYKSGTSIVTCGRITPAKNHELLIRAFQKVRDQFPDECLYIYGETEDQFDLQGIIDELKLTDCVFLMGRSENIPQVLSEAKLFVLSSDYEGMPNALMEAMAVGVPSISTDCSCGGPKELFGDELSDMLVPVGDVDALADKMTELLSNEEKRMTVGRLMKIRAEQFRTEIVGEKWVNYVQSLL